jgi:hypothetical protein
MGITINKVINNVKKEVINTYNTVKKEVTSYDYKKMVSDGVKQIIVDPFKQAVKDTGGTGALIGGSINYAQTKSPISTLKSSAVGWTAEVLVRTGINGLQGAHNFVTQNPQKYVIGQR